MNSSSELPTSCAISYLKNCARWAALTLLTLGCTDISGIQRPPAGPVLKDWRPFTTDQGDQEGLDAGVTLFDCQGAECAPQSLTCDEGQGVGLNACGRCGALPTEICDGVDNDCDGATDEELLNACGGCGETPTEVCDGIDNDCDGESDEWLLNSCGGCGPTPAEVCDDVDNDCDGWVDEGLINDCGTCGLPPVERCDLIDNDCDGVVDEAGCVVTDVIIDDECVMVQCPEDNPHPVGCQIDFQGEGNAGCVAHRPGESTVYFQEGESCGSGRVVGVLICSSISGIEFTEESCQINREERHYRTDPDDCPAD